MKPIEIIKPLGAITLTILAVYAFVEHKHQEQLSQKALQDIATKLERIDSKVATLQKDVNEIKLAADPIKLTSSERKCLERNIYFEAGVENEAGKIAVAQVTYNRLKDGRWGNQVCHVVYAKSQFSWTLYSKKVNETPKGKLWDNSKNAADKFIQGHRVQSLGQSMFYHAQYINKPRWAKKMKKVAKIGQHVFYKG